MRSAATYIGILITGALFLTSCGLTPQTQAENRAELNKLKGPDVGNIETTLKAQADEEVAAGNYIGAAETYRQIVDKYPDNVEYATAFADTLRRAGDVGDALTQAEKTLAKNPKNPSALETKALCLMEKGDFNGAGQAFGEVMKADDKRWRTLNGIGILFAMKTKYDDAIAYYKAALNQSPDNPSILNNYGLTLAMNKQYEQAFETFAMAKQHLPTGSLDIKHVDLNLALVYAIDGKLDEAEQTAAPYLSKAALYNNMGFYAYISKNTELSKSYLNMALTQSPVYYERAWKNLNAISGDNSSDANGGPGDSPPPPSQTLGTNLDTKKTKEAPSKIPPSPDSSQPLKDIPSPNTNPAEDKSSLFNSSLFKQDSAQPNARHIPEGNVPQVGTPINDIPTPTPNPDQE